MKTMNKYLMGMLAVGLALASCSKEEVTDTELTKSSNLIGFSSYANLAKGSAIADNTAFSVADRDFGVTSFISTNTTDPYMGTTSGGAKIVYSTAWDYDDNSDSRYWPTVSGETLDFYAYTPYDDTNASRGVSPSFDATGGMVFADYVVPTTITAQEDFMYASVSDVTSSTTSAVTNGAVSLQFKHALTQINFTAQTSQDNLYVDIESIKLGNINSTGTFTLDANTSTSGSDEGEWTGQSEFADYYPTIENNLAITNTSGAVDLTSGTSDILMLMPQTFAAWNATDDVTDEDTDGEGAYILISCKVYSRNGTNDTYIVGSSLNYALTALPISSVDGDTYEWTAGKKVTYNIIFAADGSESGGGGYDPEGGDSPVATIMPISFTTDTDTWSSSSSDLTM